MSAARKFTTRGPAASGAVSSASASASLLTMAAAALLLPPGARAAFAPPSHPPPAPSSRCASSPPRPRTTTSALGALVIDLSSAASAVDEFYRSAPLQSAFLTCGVKASVADAVAQRSELEDGDDEDGEDAGQFSAAAAAIDVADEGDDARSRADPSFSPLRNFAFILYGGLYTGVCQEIIYNDVYPRIFGDGSSPLTIAGEVAVDSFVVAPLVCLPVAYFTKAAVFNYPLREGLRRYGEDVRSRGLLAKYWSLWVPVQTLTFTVVPDHLRIAFVAAVSFFWFIILSVTSAGASGGAAEE